MLVDTEFNWMPYDENNIPLFSLISKGWKYGKCRRLQPIYANVSNGWNNFQHNHLYMKITLTISLHCSVKLYDLKSHCTTNWKVRTPGKTITTFQYLDFN